MQLHASEQTDIGQRRANGAMPSTRTARQGTDKPIPQPVSMPAPWPIPWANLANPMALEGPPSLPACQSPDTTNPKRARLGAVGVLWVSLLG